ncbi:hypothetical protein [Nostoc punctiforme]|uniref:Uncharacterized protein n=1 Tax=Nostoc punctiforme (strain ATCC 29133 / PCC 73102) TaxID=63737 RepID=B2IXE9_NOSP7|nr:hypothetical protein [Nostoc punctiforme]ACC79971.1 hypothetical protein Npun_R1248 [Nostoc punctiforme PCC 73102]
MSAKKRGQSANQRAMSTRATERSRSAGYAYAFLLILQTMLIGVNAENRIQQGDSPIEVLIWMINQCIPVLKQASSLQEKQKKSLLPKHRRSEDQ